MLVSLATLSCLIHREECKKEGGGQKRVRLPRRWHEKWASPPLMQLSPISHTVYIVCSVSLQLKPNPKLSSNLVFSLCLLPSLNSEKNPSFCFCQKPSFPAPFIAICCWKAKPEGERTHQAGTFFPWFNLMGNCLSAQIKAESPCNTGGSSRCVSTDGTDLSVGSKVSSVSVPPTPRSEGEILQSSNLKSFTFADLKMATRNFRPDSVLGEGGFGSVFKGWIDRHSFAATKPGTGMVIAVKRLKQESSQGHSEWLAEVNYLGQLSHPHLVKLIGYCLEDEHRLLVYEFMPRGSLENHLFRRGSYFQPLSWNLRLKVALGAAKGLAFLHSAETKVIYRDFKTSNILLDSNYNAKLSDFGLAKDGPTGDKSHVSTRVMGTYGYAAPEYLATGHLTANSDVYSFGVVMLEMLSGRRAIDKNRPSGQHNLVEWAKPYLANKRKIFRILDNRLEGQYSMDVAFKASTLALRCLSMEAKFRPSMAEAVKTLQCIHDSNENGSTDSHLSEASRMHRRSADDFSSRRPAASYPRPSTSPLYA